jgi:hypothetical protein
MTDAPLWELMKLVEETERLAKERIRLARERKPDVGDQLRRYGVPMEDVSRPCGYGSGRRESD